jgi:hypothetical protein
MSALRSWASDPLVRFKFTRSFGFRLWPMLLVTAGFILAEGRDRIEWLGILFLGWAALACVVDLLQMQEDGRLDQIRLSGQPPAAFLAAFAASTSGPWLALGLIVIVIARLQGSISQSLTETAAIIGFLLALIVGGLRIGLQQSSVDPRLVVAVLIAGAMGIVLIGESARQSLLELRAVTAPFLIAIEAAVILWLAHPLIGLIARPAAAPVGSSWGARMPQRGWMLRWPGLFRCATVSFNGVVLIVVFGPLIVLARLFVPVFVPGETAVFYVGPLIIGLVAVSILCREDAMSGRLEMLRQSAMRPSRTALEAVMGFWTPFAGVGAALALLTWALFGVTQFGILSTVVVLALVAPLPVVEGWSRHWTLTYIFPFVLSVPFFRGGWAVPLVLSALHWYAVPRKFSNPDAPVLSGWLAVAAACSVAAAFGVTRPGGGPGIVGMAVGPTLLAISPLLVDARTTLGRQWLDSAVIAVAAGAAALPGFGASASMAIAAAAGLTWVGAWRIVAFLPARPVAQAMTRLIVLSLVVITVVVMDMIARVDVQNVWLLLAMGAGVGAAAEITARIAAHLGRAEARPATPPA